MAVLPRRVYHTVLNIGSHVLVTRHFGNSTSAVGSLGVFNHTSSAPKVATKDNLVEKICPAVCSDGALQPYGLVSINLAPGPWVNGAVQKVTRGCELKNPVYSRVIFYPKS